MAKKISMPRYYKNKIYDEYQQQMLLIKHKEVAGEAIEKPSLNLVKIGKIFFVNVVTMPLKKCITMPTKGGKTIYNDTNIFC